MPMTVEAYVEARIPPQHMETVERLRDLLCECAPDTAELISYDMICWKQHKLFAYLLASEKDVTLGFIHGTDLRDDAHLLKGRGKGTRHVKIKTADAIPEAAIRDFVAQALVLDTA